MHEAKAQRSFAILVSFVVYDFAFCDSNCTTTLEPNRLTAGPFLGTTAQDNTASASTTKYRLCFVWREGNAFSVEIVDYH